MDFGDLFFYGIIAISVVSSIAKAVKKKPENEEQTGMPDFKGARVGDIFKTILEEMGDKDDDFIPSNPKPVQPIRTESVSQPKAQALKRTDLASAYADERARNITEHNKPRRASFNAVPTVETEGKQENVSDSILQSLDLRQSDELKKAIIYTEIIRPKF